MRGQIFKSYSNYKNKLKEFKFILVKVHAAKNYFLFYFKYFIFIYHHLPHLPKLEDL